MRKRHTHVVDGYGRNNNDNNNIEKISVQDITDGGGGVGGSCSVLKKGAWTKQEDDKLIRYIRKHGEGHWRTLPQAAGLVRCGKSCRLRWVNYLKPDLKRGSFGEDEEDLIIKLHALLGNRWSLIAGRLPGRTDNEVKNYWNSHLKRKLISNGIDPNNHRLHQTLSRSSIISQFPTIQTNTSHTHTHTHIINNQTTNNSHDQSTKLLDDDQLASNSDSWSCVIQDNSTTSNNNNLNNNSSNSFLLLPDLNLEFESSQIVDVQEESGDGPRQLNQQHCACNDIIWSLKEEKKKKKIIERS